MTNAEEIEHLRAENARLVAENAELRAHLTRQAAQIAELQRRLAKIARIVTGLRRAMEWADGHDRASNRAHGPVADNPDTRAILWSWWPLPIR